MMNRTNSLEPMILSDQEMSDVAAIEFLGGQAVMFSARCPDKTTANEDVIAVVPIDEETGVLIVADGMGGHAAGEAAAKLAIDELITAIQESAKFGSLLRSAIVTGFERANEKVQGLGTGGGTTLSVVEISAGQARPYHAGDSLILIVGSKGKIKLQTTSHSPVGFGVEAGLIDAEAALHHEELHVVLNAVGSDTMRIEIGSSVNLAKRDTVLLATDGLTDNLFIDDIVQHVRRGQLATSCQQVADAGRQRMTAHVAPCKPDDLSFIAYRPSRRREA